MHIQRIRFDQVFDVQTRARSFSFTSEGKHRYGIRLPGRIVPHTGATYVVAFAQRDDWSKVLGWRELGSAQVFQHRPSWPVVWGMTEALLWLIAAGSLAAAKVIGLWTLPVVACVAVLTVLHLRRRKRAVRAALLAAA